MEVGTTWAQWAPLMTVVALALAGYALALLWRTD